MNNERYHPRLEDAGLIEHQGVLYIPLEEANNAALSIQELLDGYRRMWDTATASVERHAAECVQIRGLCVSIARDLAMHGGDDHKSKNEAILRAVARLLHIDSAYAEGGARDDEIPF